MEFYKNSKKIMAKTAKYDGLIIMDIPNIGSYLYIYENGIGIFDYLQDSVDICKEQAFEDFEIPIDSWFDVFD